MWAPIDRNMHGSGVNTAMHFSSLVLNVVLNIEVDTLNHIGIMHSSSGSNLDARGLQDDSMAIKCGTMAAKRKTVADVAMPLRHIPAIMQM